MKEQTLIKLLSYPLAAHLLYSSAMLMIQHFGIYYKRIPNNLEISGLIFFALTYSLITVVFLNKYPKIALITILAILDGFGVAIKYYIFVNQTNFANTIAIYFGIYTGVIIMFSGFLFRYYLSEKSNLQSEKTENKPIKSEYSKYEIYELCEIKKKFQNQLNPTKDENKRTELQSKITEIDNEIKRKVQP